MVEQVVLSDDRLSEAFLLPLSVSLERTHFDLCRVRPSITAGIPKQFSTEPTERTVEDARRRRGDRAGARGARSSEGGAAALNAPSKQCLQSRHAVKMQAHLHQIRILLKIQMTISE